MSHLPTGSITLVVPDVAGLTQPVDVLRDDSLAVTESTNGSSAGRPLNERLAWLRYACSKDSGTISRSR